MDPARRTDSPPAGPAPAGPPGEVHLGVPGTARRPLAAVGPAGGPAVAAPLVVRVDLPWLAGVAETWTAPEEPRLSRRGPVRLACAGAVAFAVAELPDAAGASLEAATRRAYGGLLRATADAGYPHLLRVWGVVPRINEPDDDLERYRRFCRARAEAFEELWGAGFERRLPASTAVGGRGEHLVVYLLAARTPGEHRENPRQVAAWAYPPCYGPRSPSFARATLCPPEAGGHLLISGTAAIVGHASVHPGSLRLQTRETLRNLRRLLAGGGHARELPVRQLRVYLRRAADLAAVAAELRDELGDGIPTTYLQADICRRELLVEIEAVA